MEIKTEITKQIFEEFVPVAKMPERNTSVFERLQGLFEELYTFYCVYYLGDLEEEALKDEKIKRELLRCVCLGSFIRCVRSLDLVLTATGFGIVSTESTAPASAARVNALIEELSLQSILAEERLLTLLQGVEGWSKSRQAEMQIDILFWCPQLMRRYCIMPLTAGNWVLVQGRAKTVDIHLRSIISDEYMSYLVKGMREGLLSNDDIIIMDMCNRLTGAAVACEDSIKMSEVMRTMGDHIVAHLERYIDRYAVYASSRPFSARHAKGYNNEKNDPSFFFM